MTTFQWNITKLDTRSDEINQNVVITAWFKIFGIDGQYTATYENGVGLGEVGNSFIPFSQLTEDQLIQWCKDILTPEYCQTLEQGVQNKIDGLKALTQQPQLPWAT